MYLADKVLMVVQGHFAGSQIIFGAIATIAAYKSYKVMSELIRLKNESSSTIV